MDLTKLNPCEYEIYVKAMAWAETECWCCTATRALLVAFLLGVSAGLTLAGSFVVAIWFFIITAPLAVAALFIARRIWKDSYKSEDG